MTFAAHLTDANIKKVQVFTKEEDEKIIKLAEELKKDWIKIAS